VLPKMFYFSCRLKFYCGRSKGKNEAYLGVFWAYLMSVAHLHIQIHFQRNL